MREYRAKNRERLIIEKNQRRKNRPLSALWRQMLKKKAHGLSEMSKEEFMALTVPSVCPVLGIPISYDLDRDHWPSVDRINPNLPYKSGNVAIISFRANMIKSVGNSEEHEKIATWLKKFPRFEGKLFRSNTEVGSRVLYFWE